jgi:hypothetical protein
VPDFTVVLEGGIQVPWIDLPSAVPQQASRLVNDLDHLRGYRRFIPPAIVTVKAVVSGIEAPLDVDLAGRVFVASWVDWSGDAAPPITLTPGQSSLVLVGVTADHAGHHILRLRRDGGGAWLVPFDVEVV